jgi:hypothetical protein
LEQGDLDYILTVDIFNEGVDIPTVNQVVMLRQTQSAIVFVQQLGRGLRRAQDKDYLVVIDIIGNYSSNFLIPIALFGDDTLNREALRERLNETVESGALPGLSSVNFDEVSRARVLKSISETKLDSMQRLKSAVVAMSNRVGGVPALWDFYRFQSVDPVVLATARSHYPALAHSFLKTKNAMSESADRALHFMSHEILPAKRLHEFVLLELLLESEETTRSEFTNACEGKGLPCDPLVIESAIQTLMLRGYKAADVKRYREPLVECVGDVIRLTPTMRHDMSGDKDFRRHALDILHTGQTLTADRYDSNRPFTPGMQYTRRDAARLIGRERKIDGTIFGMLTDTELRECLIFVELDKPTGTQSSVAYKDELLDPSTMRWFSTNSRYLKSTDVAPIVEGRVRNHVFVQRSGLHEKKNHYYLGEASAHDARETTMANDKGKRLPVVEMTLKFDSPVRQGLFDYFN